MTTARRRTRKPLTFLTTRAVAIFVLPTLLLAMACTDQDAAANKVIADYYNLDVSTFGDKPVAPVQGVGPFESEAKTPPVRAGSPGYGGPAGNPSIQPVKTF